MVLQLCTKNIDPAGYKYRLFDRIQNMKVAQQVNKQLFVIFVIH